MKRILFGLIFGTFAIAASVLLWADKDRMALALSGSVNSISPSQPEPVLPVIPENTTTTPKIPVAVEEAETAQPVKLVCKIERSFKRCKVVSDE